MNALSQTILTLFGLIFFWLLLFALFWKSPSQPVSLSTFNDTTQARFWVFTAIDTMKYSRDRSREFLGDKLQAQAVIRRQLAAIADTGASHVALATPYDEEFLPILRLWVQEARAQGLSIWYRGNWSGWEGWFGYPVITPEQHLNLTQAFVQKNADLFQNGDYFTACPECENGKRGPPNTFEDLAAYRRFLIQEHEMLSQEFTRQNKDIQVNLNSMNGDVARQVMDPLTTKKLGGVVTLDHYVADPARLATDAAKVAQASDGRVVLGEFGAPIPDIHGQLTDQQQATWLDAALEAVVNEPSVTGMNYWTSFGGSTALWRDDETAKPAVQVIKKYFQPKVLQGKILDPRLRPIAGATVLSQQVSRTTNQDGFFVLPYTKIDQDLQISAEGFQTQVTTLQDFWNLHPPVVILKRNNPSLFLKFQDWLGNPGADSL